jgi:putative membrane protein
MATLLLSLPLADFDGHMDWDGGWSVVMVVGMVLFWALVIVGIIWLLRELRSSTASRSKPDDDPLRILDRRLADGLISPDDYRERRAILADEDAHSDH